MTFSRASRFASISAGLMATLGLLPGLIAVPTVGLYLILPEALVPRANLGFVSVGLGFLAGVVAWLVLGILFYWTADPARASSGVYRDLAKRYLEIQGRTQAVAGQVTEANEASYLLAMSMRQELEPVFTSDDKSSARLSSQWVTATGYIGAWHSVHRAEEALMLIEPKAQAIARALYDRGRLAGSSIPGRDDLLAQSAAAITALDPSMAGVMGFTGEAGPKDQDSAQMVLMNIKKTVNEYRDGLWESLVFLRRRTIQALLFVGLTGYLVVGLALIQNVDPTAVAAASAFYLAGAMIGLFHAAYLEQKRRTAVEDYGLATARLLLLPVIAGIAGLVGAGITAFLAAPPLGKSLLDQPDLTKVFSLSEYPMGLVAAAIFGLTPGLLLDRIKALGDDVKFDIKKSDPTGNEKADDTTDD
jgi:hypothetical protein